MHMRIIAGDARGKVIEAPEGMDTRPVTDKIRQALFNIWQFDIRDTSFLDLFPDPVQWDLRLCHEKLTGSSWWKKAEKQRMSSAAI